jgi:hypothetical protein
VDICWNVFTWEAKMKNRGKFYLWSGIGVATLLLTLGICVYPIYSLFRSEYSGPYHNTTAVGDLDGDRDLDVVLTNLRKENELTYWGDITLWRNQGGGYFTPDHLDTPPFLYLSTGVGDMDGDGDADILALASDSLWLFRNQGGAQNGEPGAFMPKSPGVRPDGDTGTPGSLHLGDLNRDGEPDAFVAGCCGMYLHEEHPGGNLVIEPVSWAWLNTWDRYDRLVSNTIRIPELDGLHLRAAALGDLNGDGSLDVYAATLSPEAAIPDGAADRILLNNGSGSLVDSGQRLGLSESTAVALADLDGDGDLDALVGTSSGGEVWLNQGGAQGGETGILAPSEQALAGNPTEAVFLADFDRDGDQDALIAGVKQAVIWRNDGQGNFTRTNQRFRYSERHGLAVADFNADGNPDIFAGVYTFYYRVWLNQGDGTFRPRNFR